MSASKIKRDANGALCIYSQDEDRCNSASVIYAILKFWEYNSIVKDDRKNDVHSSKMRKQMWKSIVLLSVTPIITSPKSRPKYAQMVIYKNSKICYKH